MLRVSAYNDVCSACCWALIDVSGHYLLSSNLRVVNRLITRTQKIDVFICHPNRHTMVGQRSAAMRPRDLVPTRHRVPTRDLSRHNARVLGAAETYQQPNQQSTATGSWQISERPHWITLIGRIRSQQVLKQLERSTQNLAQQKQKVALRWIDIYRRRQVTRDY